MTCRTLLILLAASACVAPASYDETTAELDGATTIVSLTFDDTFADNYQIGDMGEMRGVPVTFYVNSSRIGLAGYMTRAQLLALQNQGHEIGGHTISHANLTTLAEADARGQVCNDRVALLDAGLAVTSFAYPFGANNATVERMVAECGYNSGRDVGGLGSCSTCLAANPVPPDRVYALRTYGSISSATTLEQLQQQVTRAEQTGGGHVPVVFHRACDNCGSSAVSPTTLAAFMDWLAARGPATQVATVHQVIGGAVKPGVTAAPPTTEPPPASNMLRNPSLETDADGNQVPDCWQRGGSGTNTFSYALVTDAYDGSVAQRITISSYSSGARRLVSAQDLGTCAPPVTPGRTYTVTAFYKATTQPRFTIYYRSSTGAWVYWAQSALLPTSSTYRQATYTTPALPSGATHLSIGLSIYNVGTLTVDAHRLVDASPTTTDTTAPTLSIACNGTTCSTNAYSSAVTVSLSATDAGSGVREVRYTTNGSDPTNGTLYSAPFTVSSSATVRATAVDNASNRASLTASIVIESTTPPPPADTTAPSLSITCNGTTCSTSPYSSAVTVALSASDAGSGVREIRYTTDGSDPVNGTLYSSPFSVSASATVRATAVDNAGNRALQSASIVIGASPPPPATTNLLLNPSLETDANGDGIPDCWRPAGYGTNTATFTVTSDALEGRVAGRFDITSWSSGGRRLVSVQDAGTCAPRVTPGRRYTLTAYYKGTVSPRFTVYIRNTSGSWVWFAQSAALPTSSPYRVATYTTPTLPADATHISIGLSIFSVGSITSDAYTLVEAP